MAELVVGQEARLIPLAQIVVLERQGAERCELFGLEQIDNFRLLKFAATHLFTENDFMPYQERTHGSFQAVFQKYRL